MDKTLLLNVTYEPLRVISWRKAVTLMVLGKVEIVEAYDCTIRSVSFSVPLPSVVRLLTMVSWRRDVVQFSRKNICVRDRGMCQYCGTQLPHQEITYDHVIPKSQGGLTSWENVVICCLRCNSKKGNKTPQQAGMKLITPPKKPQWHPAFRITSSMTEHPESWHEYLYWNVQLNG